MMDESQYVKHSGKRNNIKDKEDPWQTHGSISDGDHCINRKDDDHFSYDDDDDDDDDQFYDAENIEYSDTLKDLKNIKDDEPLEDTKMVKDDELLEDTKMVNNDDPFDDTKKVKDDDPLEDQGKIKDEKPLENPEKGKHDVPQDLKKLQKDNPLKDPENVKENGRSHVIKRLSDEPQKYDNRSVISARLKDKKDDINIEKQFEHVNENFKSIHSMIKNTFEKDKVKGAIQDAKRSSKIMSSEEEKSNIVSGDVEFHYPVNVADQHKARACSTYQEGFTESVSSAHDPIPNLEDNSADTKKFCCLDQGVRRYILEHRKEEIANIESMLSQYSVKIKPDEAADAFLISGTKDGIDRAEEDLSKFTDSVAMEKMEVQQPGLHKLFTSGRGDSMITSAENDHHCKIYKVENTSERAKSLPAKDDGVRFEASENEEEFGAIAQASSSTGTESNDPTSMTCGNVTISWKPGNIVEENASVLVGSKSGKMFYTFQIAAGPHLQKELKKRSWVPRSSDILVIKPTGDLRCNQVILTSSCHKWDGESGVAEKKLRSIVKKCLLKASQLNATSIAFPVIGTGGHGFPKNTASRIMISEVINVTSGLGTSSLNDIRFVVLDKDKELVNAFRKEFKSASQHSKGYEKKELSEGFFRSGLKRLSGRFSRSDFGSTTVTSFGKVSVQIVQGDLVQEQADAIVNIIGTDMNMQNAGALSKAVAAAAGPAVQNECTNVGQQKPGSVVITGAGNLTRVKSIIHVLLDNTFDKTLKERIQNCIEKFLKDGDSHGFQSISIPPLLTGNLGISADASAEATFRALESECRSLQHLKKIRIVILKPEMVKAFQNKSKEYGSRPSNQSTFYVPTPPKAKEKPKALVANVPLQIVHPVPRTIMEFRLFGESKECVNRAKEALNNTLTEACITQQVEDKDVSKLAEEQRMKLKSKAFELDVTIGFEDKRERIVVRGGHEDVAVLIKEIWIQIKKANEKDNAEENAEVLSQTVKWRFQMIDQAACGCNFDKKANAEIEKAYAKKAKEVAVAVDGEEFIIDLNNSTGKVQSSGATFSVKRAVIRSNTEDCIFKHKDWQPMPSKDGKEETVHLVKLVNGSAEYEKVVNMFISGQRGRIIVKIERIQNPHLYQQYMDRKQKMDKDNPGMNNERQLFHGTKSENVSDINAKGFNRNFCGENGTLYGQGVYFAKQASYSYSYTWPDTSLNRHMYLARVLTGMHALGRPDMKVPPENPKTPGTSFDSTANSSGPDASIFVVYYDWQCYPEYLITFR